jgi:hypothetical protein
MKDMQSVVRKAVPGIAAALEAEMGPFIAARLKTCLDRASERVIGALEAATTVVRGPAEKVPAAAKVKAKKADRAPKGEIRAAVLGALGARPLGVAEIAEKAGVDLPKVRPVLAALKKSGEAISPERGMYRTNKKTMPAAPVAKPRKVKAIKKAKRAAKKAAPPASDPAQVASKGDGEVQAEAQ